MKRLAEDAANPESSHDFGYAILPEMVRRDRVFAYHFEGYWQDIGTKEAYYAANMELLGPQPSFSLNSAWHILTENKNWPSSKSDRGVIQNSLVCPGCVYGDGWKTRYSPGVTVEGMPLVALHTDVRRRRRRHSIVNAAAG
jgi:glucose-1-phosphate adenylyltransferase